MIYLGADHAGFALKEFLKQQLTKKKIMVAYVSPKKMPGDDYPLIAKNVCKKTMQSSQNKGILICGSGAGMAIAANRMKKIRAVNPSTLLSAKLAREHNDANVLCLGAWELSKKKALQLTTLFFATKFSHLSRHNRRIRILDSL